MAVPQLPTSAPLKDVKERRIRRGWTQEELAKKAGIARRTVSAAEKVGKSIEAVSIEALGRALGCNPRELIDWAAFGIPDPFASIIEYDPQIAGGRSDKKQDRKNVIQDSTISELLLAGQTPSFYRAVRSSVVWLPLSIDDKDRPQLGLLPHNHFIQPSAVVAVWLSARNQPIILGYQRSEHVDSPQFVHTQGMSLLFAASYYYYVKTPACSPMDVWMGAVESDPQSADREFPGCLLNLLAHKIDIRHFQVIGWRALGVVTNDQRSEDGSGRVYTQYISVLDVACDHVRREQDIVSSILSYGQMLRPLPWNGDTEKILCSPKGKNWMDILAWRALQTNADVLKEARCSFVKGFDLVDN